ncbi:hypothetical protein CEN49_23710 [Fischerella thermalis CCMEE 5273]|nr:hypothetical protein CI593_02750 [Fischerella thermalis CCMEE 5194]PMB03268.1 hypothetical protein CEN49_23710 [Fischerella thermalis CCMEE 5273]PMB17938.1 hypothetical protein CEN45_21515 [Fischerella thermalis CCMEE 5198]PMB52058.1 hypothetical protein CEN39_11880 [Fischerella thermalis CCMEE 5201]
MDSGYWLVVNYPLPITNYRPQNKISPQLVGNLTEIPPEPLASVGSMMVLRNNDQFQVLFCT